MWGRSQDKPPKESAPEVPKDESKKEPPAFDSNKLPDGKKLPPALQKIVDKSDKEDNFFDELVEG